MVLLLETCVLVFLWHLVLTQPAVLERFNGGSQKGEIHPPRTLGSIANHSLCLDNGVGHDHRLRAETLEPRVNHLHVVKACSSTHLSFPLHQLTLIKCTFYYNKASPF